mmetsp:Transcript_19426/g.42436  ORF Transcript_19426/g.42436 Transcript_19426/m.42436 type:complete len:330 (-) Transcript_19426:186-1175(-)
MPEMPRSLPNSAPANFLGQLDSWREPLTKDMPLGSPRRASADENWEVPAESDQVLEKERKAADVSTAALSRSVDLTKALEKHILQHRGFAQPAYIPPPPRLAGHLKVPAKRSFSSSRQGKASSSSVRLGVPRSIDETQLGLEQGSPRTWRYLDVPGEELDGFRQFARDLSHKASVECAPWNPYVQALAAHRRAMEDCTVNLDSENVDSLEARLATQRTDAVAALSVSQNVPDYTNPMFMCQASTACEDGREPSLEFELNNEWEKTSSGTSTTARSLHSEALKMVRWGPRLRLQVPGHSAVIDPDRIEKAGARAPADSSSDEDCDDIFFL